MKLIAHRGNTNGPNPKKENTLAYIKKALKDGYGVEIDIWKRGSHIFFGHDEPTHLISWGDFFELLFNTNVWFHCKNLDILKFLNLLKSDFGHIADFFWHENDQVTITSYGNVWRHPNTENFYYSPTDIKCNPEQKEHDFYENDFFATCSDYVELLK